MKKQMKWMRMLLFMLFACVCFSGAVYAYEVDLNPDYPNIHIVSRMVNGEIRTDRDAMPGDYVTIIYGVPAEDSLLLTPVEHTPESLALDVDVNNQEISFIMPDCNMAINLKAIPGKKLIGTVNIEGSGTFGEKLTALVYGTNGKNLQYQWMIDGEVVGTEQTYIPTIKQVNKDLYCRVSDPDKGNYIQNRILVTGRMHTAKFEIAGEGEYGFSDSESYKITKSFSFMAGEEVIFYIANGANCTFTTSVPGVDVSEAGSRQRSFSMPDKDIAIYMTFVNRETKLSKAKVNVIRNTFTYDGKEHRPEVEVYLDDEKLTNNVDYYLDGAATGAGSYVSHVLPGTGSVYTESQNVPFTILPSETVAAALDTQTFVSNGKEQRPKLTVTGIQGAVLKEADDYTVSWPAESKEAGTYTVSVDFKGNYKGKIQKTYVIEPVQMQTEEKPGEQAGAGQEEKPDEQPDAGTEEKPGEQAGTGQEEKPDEQPDAGTEEKPGEQAGTGQEEKPGEQAGTGQEEKPDEQPDAGTEEKPDTQPGAGSEEKPDAGQEEKPDEQPDAGTEEKPDAQPGAGAGAQTNADKVSKGAVWTLKKHSAVVKITSVKNKEVTYVGCSNKKAVKVVIPNTVSIDGKTFKITAIGAKALKGNTYVKQVWIGKNVKTIGKQAFYGCRKLRKVTLKSTKLKAKGFGKYAFSKISKKVKYSLPASKRKAYLKILKKY